MQKIFVTGASGLVGRWLCKALLENKMEVVALVRDEAPSFPQINPVRGDLTDLFSLERAINEYEIDTVFHLGAQTLVGAALRQPLMTFETNIRGTYNLLEACRKQGSQIQRIVIASSDKAYGDSATLPYTEEMSLAGKHPYDVSKSCADLIATTYYQTYGLPIVIARCGNIFGGGDLNWSRLIPGTIRNLYYDLRPEIRSDGSFTRDYIYVEDIVQAYLLLARHAVREDVEGEAFNFGHNRPHSVLEVVHTIQDLMQRKDLSPIIHNQAAAEIREQALDAEKAMEILSWKPAYRFEEALLKTIEWYIEYFENNHVMPILRETARA